MPGTLYLVATPIGNLQDITLRALATLKAVSRIAAEDTRRTRALLSHFAITGKHLVSCNAYASESALAELVRDLESGQDLALVTDAGTPSVSDPGTPLVRAAVSAGIAVVPIPGVSAVTTAVAASGLVDGPFRFLGFAPPKAGRRASFFADAMASQEPFVLFEAPHRIERTLAELSALAPERPAVLCRELTKLHEEHRRGTLAELVVGAEQDPIRGEVTLVVAAGEPRPAYEPSDDEAIEASILSGLRAGESPRSVVEALSAGSGLARRELYRRVTEIAQRLNAESGEENRDGDPDGT